MKNLDSTHVQTTMQWVEENRSIREVRMLQKMKRKKQIITTILLWLTGSITVLGCMAWFEVSIVARVATLLALTCFGALVLGRDEG